MAFKATPVEVPQNEPFEHDALGRVESATAIHQLIDALSGPFVLALDSPWGTGKTTFAKMVQAVLENSGYQCLYFNAWTTDFSSDPMLAFLGELNTLIGDRKPKESEAAKNFRKAKKVASILAKKAIPVAGKLATAGVLDLGAFTEKALADFVSDALSDAVDAYSAEKDLIAQFRSSLESSVADLLAESEKTKIVIFVDELDRCRPTYAVDLLERIKHLFDIANVVFVLSLDKSQLGISLGAVYGENIDSEEYLRRFIDLEYRLPRPDAIKFSKHLVATYGIDEIFHERAKQGRDFGYEPSNLLDTFVALADLYHLSLRAREHCFTILRVAYLFTPTNYLLYPHLTMALIVLRFGAPEVYRKFVFDNGTAREVIEHLEGSRLGKEFLLSHAGSVLTAYLISVKRDRWRDENPELAAYKKAAENASLPEAEREAASKVVAIHGDFNFRDRVPTLSYIVGKIELASRFDQ